MRNTASLRAILDALLKEPETARYGRELVKRTGFQSGTVNVILDRLAAEGYISQEWEDVDPKAAGRPPRRYSRLTERGVAFAQEKLGEWEKKAIGWAYWEDEKS